MIQYNGNILMIGCGAVAQCSIPLLLQHITLTPKNIIIIDPFDIRPFLPEQLKNNTLFKQTQITKKNYTNLLSEHLQPGDMCIDLANGVDTYDVLTWCQKNEIMYFNTGLNSWPSPNPVSYYKIYQAVKKFSHQHPHGPTAVITHGANPGLISSFVKQGLIDFAHHALDTRQDNCQRIERALQNLAFSSLAQLLDVRTIHVTEQDTQVIAHNPSQDEFLNTWSIAEFAEECTDWAEFAWGTHEVHIPKDAQVKDGNIFLSNRALNVHVDSWIPYQEYSGMVVPHDETFTIADYLSIKNNTELIYRPSVLFVYDPCPAAKKSLLTLAKNNFVCQNTKHVIKKEIIDGTEKMGCLLMSPHGSWWTGSLVSIQESNRVLPGNNATVLQVAAGVLTGIQHLLQNPQKGICLPEQLNHNQVLTMSKPYLGNFISEQVDWKHKKNCNFYLKKNR